MMHGHTNIKFIMILYFMSQLNSASMQSQSYFGLCIGLEVAANCDPHWISVDCLRTVLLCLQHALLDFDSLTLTECQFNSIECNF